MHRRHPRERPAARRSGHPLAASDHARRDRCGRGLCRWPSSTGAAGPSSSCSARSRRRASTSRACASRSRRPRNRLVTAALIAAVAIQQLVHARDGAARAAAARERRLRARRPARCSKPAAPSSKARPQRQKNPHPKGSLAYAAWVCARLGGWTGYYGKPGPIVMLEGWLEFQAMKRGVSLLTRHQQGSPCDA